MATLFANLSSAALVEEAIRRGEGQLAATGPLTARTGKRTGRSPKDKYIVREPVSEAQVDWLLNQPMDPAVFDKLRKRIEEYLPTKDRFTFDGYAAADPAHRIKLRLVAEKAWHALFARCLFLRPKPEELINFTPDWTILAACDYALRPGPRWHEKRSLRGYQLRAEARADRAARTTRAKSRSRSSRC